MSKTREAVWVVIGCAALLATACSSAEPEVPAGQNADKEPAWYRDGMQKGGVGRPKVLYPVARGVSRPLLESAGRAPRALQRRPGERPAAPVRRDRPAGVDTPVSDAPVQLDADVAPPPSVSFDGLSNADNLDIIGFDTFPPDVNGDVGPNHYVQYINLVIGVFDKRGVRMAPPVPGNAPWAGFGGPCEENIDGSPIVLYDQLADRWVLSQLAFAAEGGHQCFAVSQTPDPLGAYFLYDFLVSPNGAFNDYPKIGVWPDAYYLTFNEFGSDLTFSAAVAVAVDRQAMILGQPAAMVRFPTLGASNEIVFSVQPAHLEGLALPPAGSPGFFLNSFDDEVWSVTPDPTQDRYNLWALQVDWTDPGASTLVGPAAIPAPEFDADLCSFERSCIPTPGGAALDPLSAMSMYRLAYRNLGDHEAMVINHTIDVGGDRAGIRWTEIRDPNGAPELFQTGTFAPDDGVHRWMGSIAMDARGDIAIGYSVAGADTFPGLRYAARAAGDPPGELGQGEAVLVAGSSAQTASSRWGDYQALSVDESNDCTFWFTGEYGSAERPGDWSTRVAAFELPLCSATAIGSIAGQVRRANGTPLAGALVAAGPFSSVAAADGTYSFDVAAGTYEVTATAFGFGSQTVSGVVVGDGETARVNFRLTASPRVPVRGVVTDDGGAGWPLYAEVLFEPVGAPSVRVFTDPVTGAYAVKLPAGAEFAVTVHAIAGGYLDETRPITAGPGPSTHNFALEVNTGTCDALGYTLVEVPIGSQDFDGGAFPPEGWTVETDTLGCDFPGGGSWTDADLGERSNLTGGSGVMATADSDICGSSVAMSTTLTSPPFDLSRMEDDEGLQITFRQDLLSAGGTDARVEVWDGAEWQAISQQFGDGRTIQLVLGTKAANGVADARIRFVYTSGWDFWWQLDDIAIATTSCEFRGGGLVLGTITDRNTTLGIVGARVEATGEPPVTTAATPDDAALKDGLYIQFLAGPGRITASHGGYETRGINVTPVAGGALRRDIGLRAGRVRVEPGELSLRVPFRGEAAATLRLTNDGTAPATVDISELSGPVATRPTAAIGPVAPPSLRFDRGDVSARTARGVAPSRVPAARILASGDLVRRIPTGLELAWGIGFDVPTLSGWVSNPSAGGGDDLLHQYLNDGTSSGETIDVAAPQWGADLAYDSRTNKLWQVNVGGDNCIHEIDVVGRRMTGNVICPAFGTSERGLAYDAVSDTFYAGTWNDGRIVQFDRSGAILREFPLDLSIAGLAYNAATGHLFVSINDLATVPDIFVFDTAEMTPIGQFEIVDGGQIVFDDFQGAGLELDCAGNLWAVNQETGEIAVAESNEPPACRADLPWLDTAPTTVTVPAGGSVVVTLTADASSLTPGLHEAQLMFITNTPYDVPAVPFHVTVAFDDVPSGAFGDPEIHGLAGVGVSYGCGGGNFCPAEPLTRAVFAVWGELSAFGIEYDPPRARGLLFDDLSPKEFGADFAEDAFQRRLIAGCGDRLYCPDQALTRREAAQYLLRLLLGAEYQPPEPAGLFSDVSEADAAYVEDAVARGIIEPCGTGLFCPDGAIDRATGAVFFVRAFGFPTSR